MDLDLDVAGIPIPWWLASQPDQVTTVTLTDDETGEAAAFTFEAFIFASGSTAVHCTYPRYSSRLTRPDPDRECHWTHPVWDEEIMIEHAKTHYPDRKAE